MVETLIEKLSIEVATGVGAAVAGLIIYIAKLVWIKISNMKQAKARKESEEIIPRLVRKDIGVYRDLTELLVQVKADRVFVMQLHNGLYYINNGNQMRMSCTHEIVKEGISREQEGMQDLLLSRFPSMIKDLLSSPYTYICTKDQHFYYAQMLRNQGVGKCVMAVMKDEGILEGFIGVSFLDGDNQDVCDKEQIEEIGRMVVKFSEKIGYTLRKNSDE